MMHPFKWISGMYPNAPRRNALVLLLYLMALFALIATIGGHLIRIPCGRRITPIAGERLCLPPPPAIRLTDGTGTEDASVAAPDPFYPVDWTRRFSALFIAGLNREILGAFPKDTYHAIPTLSCELFQGSKQEKTRYNERSH